MIDSTIRVSFRINNLTEFEWHELQAEAQKLADTYTLHTIPEFFNRAERHLITYHDQDLAVFVRYVDKAIEFLFIQSNICMVEVPHGE